MILPIPFLVQIQQRRLVTPETLLAQYAYDEANQLVREDNAQLNQTVTYIYDKGGNITEKSVYPFTTGTVGMATDTITYTYDSTWKDMLASYDGTLIDNDELGSPWLYTHDRCFVWSARELRYANLEDGSLAEYSYNENSLRSLKIIYDENGYDVDGYYYYFWSDDGRLLAYTVDQTGSEDPYSVLVLYNSDQEPIGFTVGDDTYYYLKNIQGDVLCVTDAEGTPIVNYTYDAWGMMTVSPASQNVPSQTVVNVAFLNPVTYRGYFYDYELGLYYLQSRYYDPETGRFISADTWLDPYADLLSSNLFSYCLNNSIKYTDRSGKVAVVDDFFYMGITAVVITSFAIMFIAIVPSSQQTAKAFRDWLSGIIPVSKHIPLSIFSAILYLAKQSKQSKKSRSTDLPSWAKQKPPHINEKAKDYAKRILDEKYGKNNWPKGPGSEYSQIVKNATRNLGLK